MGSELWFREMERILNEKEAAIEESGLSAAEQRRLKAKAYDEAGEEAGPALAERLADMADLERKRRREGGK
jgi:hypothetical protein